MVAKDVNINNFYWGIKQKFQLEIGVKNFINPEYPDIIWFKQGIYVITSFNTALTNNNYSISISGKDKMCLLNGDLGGNLPASIDFGKIDIYDDTYTRITFQDKAQYEANKYYIYDNGKYIKSKEKYNPNLQYYMKDRLLNQKQLIIKDIIREAVHVYGKELYHNIIINDLDDYGLELLEYRGDQPLFLLYDEEASMYDQMVNYQSALKVQVEDINTKEKFYLANCPNFNTAVDNLNENRTKFYLEINGIKKIYSISKIEYGQTAGYRVTDLTYSGELISSIGESLTSVLDKIIKMLGPFEYFYDVNGKFIFQAKKIYAKNSWTPIVHTDEDYFVREAVEESPYSYSFEDLNLIQRFQNTPSINNLKNDYSIWGTRKSITGAEIPIHARFAIHEKPEYYKTFEGNIYCTEEYQGELNAEFKRVDWREIIYQMAKDYYKNNQEESFSYILTQNNCIINDLGEYVVLYPSGQTGYEMFYEDIQGFWRQLYDPEPELIYPSTGGEYIETRLYKVLNLTEELYLKNPKAYFVLISGEYTSAPGWIKDAEYFTNTISLASEEFYKVATVWNPFEEQPNYICDYYLKGDKDDENYSTSYYYWNKAVNTSPETLNFWFDFYQGSDLMQYGISIIGDRQKVVNDSKITSVYFRNVPKVIFIDANKEEYDMTRISAGYQYAQLSKDMENLFTISAQGKSAEEEMEQLLNNYSYCSEGLSITTIPVYNLEPNTLIHLYNEETGINGKYCVNNISIPLIYNGVMNITATKIIDQIY